MGPAPIVADSENVNNKANNDDNNKVDNNNSSKTDNKDLGGPPNDNLDELYRVYN